MNKRPPRYPSPAPASVASPLRRVPSAPTSGSKLRPPRGRSPGGGSDLINGGFTGEGRRRSSSFSTQSPTKKTDKRPRSFSPPSGGGTPAAAAAITAAPTATALGRQPSRGSSSGSSSSGAGASSAAAGGFRRSSVRVAVRCRPLSEDEKRGGGSTAVSVSGRTVSLSAGPKAHSYAQGEDEAAATVFAYDHVFGQSADQLEIFAACGAPLVKELVDGFNATIFAYGQTGSGKTFTMNGSALEPGLVPRATWFLFERLKALNATDASLVHPDDAYTPRAAAIEGRDGLHDADDDGDGDSCSRHTARSRRTFRLTATYLQIYNETLVDLLGETPADLKVRNSPQLGVFVSGLTEHPVRSAQDVLDLLERGNRQRTTAATRMNASSSRSHAVFTLVLEQEVEEPARRRGPQGSAQEDAAEGGKGDSDGLAEGEGYAEDGGEGLEPSAVLELPSKIRKLRSKINLVDLAGSERAKLSGADEDGKLMKECVNINKSLSALGNVIAALSEGRSTHVPYRESKLTQLLEESLGGNAQTVMINAISPLACHHAETLSTLHWAKRAQSIINVSVVGEAVDANQAMEKMAEMARLQKQAVAEAQQLARERQQEMQQQIEEALANAEASREEAEAAHAAAATRVEQTRKDFESRYEQLKATLEAELNERVAASVQRKEVEFKRQLAEAEANSGALASARAERLHIAGELAAAAKRETQLAKQLKATKAELEAERQQREAAEEYAEECREAQDAERSELEAAVARAREAADEKLEALKAEAEARVAAVQREMSERFEAAVAQVQGAARQESSTAVEAAEVAASELGDALAARDEAMAVLQSRVHTLEQEGEAAARAVEEADAAREEAEAALEEADAERSAAEAAKEQLEASAANQRIAVEAAAAAAESSSAAATQQQLDEALAKLDEAEARADAATSFANGLERDQQELQAKLEALQARAWGMDALQSQAQEAEALRAELAQRTQQEEATVTKASDAVAALAAAEAKLAVVQRHRDELQGQGQQQAGALDELRADIARARAEAKASDAKAVQAEAANAALENEVCEALASRDEAVETTQAEREKKAALQAELNSMRAEVSRSRETVGKAMGDVQVEMEARQTAWTAERVQLLQQIAAAEANRLPLPPGIGLPAERDGGRRGGSRSSNLSSQCSSSSLASSSPVYATGAATPPAGRVVKRDLSSASRGSRGGASRGASTPVNLVSNVFKSLGENFEDAGRKLGDAVDNVGKQVGLSVDNVGKQVGLSVDNVGKQFGDAVDDVAGAARSLLPGSKEQGGKGAIGKEPFGKQPGHNGSHGRPPPIQPPYEAEDGASTPPPLHAKPGSPKQTAPPAPPLLFTPGGSGQRPLAGGFGARASHRGHRTAGGTTPNRVVHPSIS